MTDRRLLEPQHGKDRRLTTQATYRTDHSPGDATPQRLGTQISWTLPANVFYGVCQCLLLVVLNKFGSPSMAGQLGLALAITAPVFLLANLRLATIVATDIRPHINLAHYFRLRAWFVWGALCLIGGALNVLGPTQITVVLILVAFTKAVEAATDLCCGVQQRIQRMDRIAVSLVANGLLMVVAFSLTYLGTKNLAWGVVGLLVARIAVLTCYDLPTLRRASRLPLFARAETRGDPDSVPAIGMTTRRLEQSLAIIRHGLPLGITAMLLSLTSSIPRYLIAHLQTEHALGIFCSLAAVMQGGTLVFRAVEQPAAPRLAHLLSSRDARGFWKLLNFLLALFLAAGLVGCGLSWLAGPYVLRLVFSAEYASWSPLLAFMFIAATVGQIAGMIESSLIAARITAIQLPMHVVTLTTCLVCGLLWIPHYGLYGTVLALIFCRFPYIVIGVLLLRQLVGSWDPSGSVASRVQLPGKIHPPHFEAARNHGETEVNAERS